MFSVHVFNQHFAKRKHTIIRSDVSKQWSRHAHRSSVCPRMRIRYQVVNTSRNTGESVVTIRWKWSVGAARAAKAMFFM